MKHTLKGALAVVLNLMFIKQDVLANDRETLDYLATNMHQILQKPCDNGIKSEVVFETATLAKFSQDNVRRNSLQQLKRGNTIANTPIYNNLFDFLTQNIYPILQMPCNDQERSKFSFNNVSYIKCYQENFGRASLKDLKKGYIETISYPLPPEYEYSFSRYLCYLVKIQESNDLILFSLGVK